MKEEPMDVEVPVPIPVPVPVPVPSRVNCTASRARGRPRKSKELPRKSKEEPPPPCRPKSPPINGVLEEPMTLGQSQHDLSQSAFLSWLSQTQSSLLKDSVLTPDSSPGNGEGGLQPLETLADPTAEEESTTEAVEKQGPWFNLLPRTPCDNRPPLTTSSAEPSPRATSQPRGQPRGEQPKASARQVGDRGQPQWLGHGEGA